MQYVLGVDGGNSKTVALLAKFDGTIVGAGRAGCGDIYRGVDRALQSVDQAVAQARRQAGCKVKRSIVSGAFSMAGADWPEDFTLLGSAFKQRGLARRITVVNDAIGAVRAGCEHGFGVAIAAGTGAATGARSRDGKVEWHSSFWQLGGAAVMLGGEAVRYLYRAELGLCPPTALKEPVLKHYELDSVQGLLHSYTGRELARPPADRLARIVLDTAHDGDAAAIRIVHEEAERLGDTAIAAARLVNMGEESFPLVMIGSVFRHDCKLLGKQIVKHVRREFPVLQPVYNNIEPCAGAVIIALEKAGVTVDEDVRARINASIPPRSFFAT